MPLMLLTVKLHGFFYGLFFFLINCHKFTNRYINYSFNDRIYRYLLEKSTLVDKYFQNYKWYIIQCTYFILDTLSIQNTFVSFITLVPKNGLVIFCGTIITKEGKEKLINMDFEAYRPINRSLYHCDNKFHTEVSIHAFI